MHTSVSQNVQAAHRQEWCRWPLGCGHPHCCEALERNESMVPFRDSSLGTGAKAAGAKAAGAMAAQTATRHVIMYFVQ